MSLVEAFKFPFCRIFFSIVVGIIALEGFVLSYNQQQEENSKGTKVTDGVLIRLIKSGSPKELPLIGQIEIPFTIKSFKGNNNQAANFNIKFSQSTKSEIPKVKFTGGFIIKKDPILILENEPDIIIGNHWLFLKFKNWSTIALTIYLLIAGMVGEFLCTLGDLIVGMCFFNFDPCSCDTIIESCSPVNDKKIKVNEILTNEIKRDFSELHFSISRLFAGLSMLSLTLEFAIRNQISSILIVLCLLTIICLSTVFNFKAISNPGFSKFSTRFCLCLILIASLIILGADLISHSISFASFIVFLILSIIFRIQANKILRS